MDLNVRNLTATDIMPMVSVINKLDFKKIVNVLSTSKMDTKARAEAEGVTGDQVNSDDALALKLAADMFLPVIGVILEDLPKCEKPLFAFLASMCGMDEKTFRALPPAAVPEALFEIVHQEGFADFFKAASRFLQ